MEGSRIRQKEKLGCNGALAKATADPKGSSEVGRPSELSRIAWGLSAPTWTRHWVQDAPRKGVQRWMRQLLLAERHFWRRLKATICLPAILLASGRVSSSVSREGSEGHIPASSTEMNIYSTNMYAAPTVWQAPC